MKKETQHNLKLKLQEMKFQVELEEEKVNLISSIIKDERERFEIGNLDLEKLIELRNDYATYKTDVEQSRFEYANLLINWLTSKNKLIYALNI